MSWVISWQPPWTGLTMMIGVSSVGGCLIALGGLVNVRCSAIQITAKPVRRPQLSAIRCLGPARIQAWKGVYRSESTVSRFTAFWRGRYPFAAFRVRRPAEFREPRFGTTIPSADHAKITF